MNGRIERRIKELSIELPPLPEPSANYVSYVRYGNLVQLSGVAPVKFGQYAFVGKLGKKFLLSDGVLAARLCALNALSNLKAACGGELDRVKKFIMIRGYVNATENSKEIPQVVNGASDLVVEIFGTRAGAHARTSIGCVSMPSGVAVEIDCLVVIDDENFRDK